MGALDYPGCGVGDDARVLVGGILGASRIALPMGQAHELPGWFGATHGRFKTPHPAVLALGLLVAALALLFHLRPLLDVVQRVHPRLVRHRQRRRPATAEGSTPVGLDADRRLARAGWLPALAGALSLWATGAAAAYAALVGARWLIGRSMGNGAGDHAVL